MSRTVACGRSRRFCQWSVRGVVRRLPRRLLPAPAPSVGAVGLDEAGRSLADAVVRVPLHGRAESLNLATAAVVCLYASARAHRDQPTDPRTDPPARPRHAGG